jgi:hypothetical protein
MAGSAQDATSTSLGPISTARERHSARSAALQMSQPERLSEMQNWHNYTEIELFLCLECDEVYEIGQRDGEEVNTQQEAKCLHQTKKIGTYYI